MSAPQLSRARDLFGSRSGEPIDLEPLLGAWRVFAERTTGITRAVFSVSAEAMRIRVIGSAAGEPPDWGEAEAMPFAESVAGGPVWGFRADYLRPDAEVRLYGYLNRGLLAIEAGTTFTDGSPRADYFTRTFLFRP